MDPVGVLLGVGFLAFIIFVFGTDAHEKAKQAQVLEARDKADAEQEAKLEAYDEEKRTAKLNMEEQRQLAARDLEPLVAETRLRVNENPSDWHLRVRISNLLLASSAQSEACENYETAIALGISETRTKGLVHLLCAYCIVLEGWRVQDSNWPLSYEALERCDPETVEMACSEVNYAVSRAESPLWEYVDPLVPFHIEESRKKFELLVRQNRRGLSALKILRYIYPSSEKSSRKRLGEIESQIVDLERLQQLPTPVPIAKGRPPHKSTLERGFDFEQRCLAILDAMGYHVTHSGKSGDGGIDIRAEDPVPIRGGRLLVQCKDWQHPVG